MVRRKEQERLDEKLTRREMLEALASVREQYSPYHDSITIELLNRLIKAIS